MDEGRRKLLKKVPTRKLLASIKKDMRQLGKVTDLAAKAKKK
jgi:ABC-type Fe3+-hydroxamate transport system substrate-binding protein